MQTLSQQKGRWRARLTLSPAVPLPPVPVAGGWAVSPRAVLCAVAAVITGNEWLRRALAQTCRVHFEIMLSFLEKCWCMSIGFPLPAFTTSPWCRWTKEWGFRWHICCSCFFATKPSGLGLFYYHMCSAQGFPLLKPHFFSPAWQIGWAPSHINPICLIPSVCGVSP